MATMDTIALKDNGIGRRLSSQRWLPWLPRTQPQRVWTPFGLHRNTFRESNGAGRCLQVYENGNLRVWWPGTESVPLPQLIPRNLLFLRLTRPARTPRPANHWHTSGTHSVAMIQGSTGGRRKVVNYEDGLPIFITDSAAEAQMTTRRS